VDTSSSHLIFGLPLHTRLYWFDILSGQYLLLLPAINPVCREWNLGIFVFNRLALILRLNSPSLNKFYFNIVQLLIIIQDGAVHVS
jgi:hypothetical protein